MKRLTDKFLIKLSNGKNYSVELNATAKMRAMFHKKFFKTLLEAELTSKKRYKKSLLNWIKRFEQNGFDTNDQVMKERLQGVCYFLYGFNRMHGYDIANNLKLRFDKESQTYIKYCKAA